MKWWMRCNSAAGKRYQRRSLVAMSLYLVILFFCLKLARAEQIHGTALYVLAVLPAIPVIAALAILGRYLQEETDEFLRMLTLRSLVIAAGALLGTIVVNDFLRVIAKGEALSPFVGFIVFFATFGFAQAMQDMAARRGSGE